MQLVIDRTRAIFVWATGERDLELGIVTPCHVEVQQHNFDMPFLYPFVAPDEVLFEDLIDNCIDLRMIRPPMNVQAS